jgi:hypothetical protein
MISEVLESCYTTKLDREFIIYKAIQNVLSERKRRQLPVFILDEQNTAILLKTEKIKPTAVVSQIITAKGKDWQMHKDAR